MIWEMINREISTSTRAGAGYTKWFAEQGIPAAITAAAFLSYLLAKATELVIRVMRAHPDNRVLWALLITFLSSLALACLSTFQIPSVIGICIASGVFLVLVAKIVEMYYDPIFQRKVSYEVLIDDVLHQPWFSLKAA